MKKPLLILLLIFFSTLGCDQRPRVQWTAYTPEAMTTALRSGKPVFAEFYAAWCGPCMDMKETTFRDAQVIAALEPFQRIKVDMSFSRSPKIQKVGEEYGVMGMPTVILFDPQGNLAERYSGYLSAEALFEILKKFKVKYHVPELPPAGSQVPA